MLGHGPVQLDRPVDRRLHQPDPAARRVHLLVEDDVRRAARQAEAAVHAVAEQLAVHGARRAAGGRQISTRSKAVTAVSMWRISSTASSPSLSVRARTSDAFVPAPAPFFTPSTAASMPARGDREAPHRGRELGLVHRHEGGRLNTRAAVTDRESSFAPRLGSVRSVRPRRLPATSPARIDPRLRCELGTAAIFEPLVLGQRTWREVVLGSTIAADGRRLVALVDAWRRRPGRPPLRQCHHQQGVACRTARPVMPRLAPRRSREHAAGVERRAHALGERRPLARDRLGDEREPGARPREQALLPRRTAPRPPARCCSARDSSHTAASAALRPGHAATCASTAAAPPSKSSATRPGGRKSTALGVELRALQLAPERRADRRSRRRTVASAAGRVCSRSATRAISPSRPREPEKSLPRS